MGEISNRQTGVSQGDWQNLEFIPVSSTSPETADYHPPFNQRRGFRGSRGRGDFHSHNRNYQGENYQWRGGYRRYPPYEGRGNTRSNDFGGNRGGYGGYSNHRRGNSRGSFGSGPSRQADISAYCVRSMENPWAELERTTSFVDASDASLSQNQKNVSDEINIDDHSVTSTNDVVENL